MDTGPEGIDDATERAAVKRQARRVHIKAAAFAVVATAVAWLLP